MHFHTFPDTCKASNHCVIKPSALQERMEKLEALRLELDSRRRTVDSLEGE